MVTRKFYQVWFDKSAPPLFRGSPTLKYKGPRMAVRGPISLAFARDQIAAKPLSSDDRITCTSSAVKTSGGDRIMFGPDTRTIAPD